MAQKFTLVSLTDNTDGTDIYMRSFYAEMDSTDVFRMYFSQITQMAQKFTLVSLTDNTDGTDIYMRSFYAEMDSTDVYRYAKRSNELFGGNYQGEFILNLLFDENYRYAIPSNNI